MIGFLVSVAVSAGSFDGRASTAACRAGLPCAEESSLIFVCAEGSRCNYTFESAARACLNRDGRLPTLKELALTMAMGYGARGLTLAPGDDNGFQLYLYQTYGGRRDGFYFSAEGYEAPTDGPRFWAAARNVDGSATGWQFDTATGRPRLAPFDDEARLACVVPNDHGA